jgi:hypothetical protein
MEGSFPFLIRKEKEVRHPKNETWGGLPNNKPKT